MTNTAGWPRPRPSVTGNTSKGESVPLASTVARSTVLVCKPETR